MGAGWQSVRCWKASTVLPSGSTVKAPARKPGTVLWPGKHFMPSGSFWVIVQEHIVRIYTWAGGKNSRKSRRVDWYFRSQKRNWHWACIEVIVQTHFPKSFSLLDSVLAQRSHVVTQLLTSKVNMPKGAHAFLLIAFARELLSKFSEVPRLIQRKGHFGQYHESQHSELRLCIYTKAVNAFEILVKH